MGYLELGIKVRATPVGKGVFASKQFRKNQVIGQVRGRLIDSDDYDPDYAIDLGKRGVLEPSTPFRFLNHSCEPNAELVEYEPKRPGEAPTMWVEAKRTVRLGEQITIDYAWPADAAIRCLCGATNCRGWVVDAAEAKKLARRRRKSSAPSVRATASL